MARKKIAISLEDLHIPGLAPLANPGEEAPAFGLLPTKTPPNTRPELLFIPHLPT